MISSRYWGIQVLNSCTCMDFQAIWTDHFSIKLYNQRLLSKAFRIESVIQRHKCIFMSTWQIPGAIKTGFDVTTVVYDGRVVRSNLRGQNPVNHIFFTNKTSFLSPQRCVLVRVAPDVCVWDVRLLLGHSIWIGKSSLGYSGPEWLYLNAFFCPILLPFQ